MDTPHSFLAITQNSYLTHWLRQNLDEFGEIVETSHVELDDALSLLQTTGASFVFVEVDEHQPHRTASLIEGLLAVRPMLVVVAIGERLDSELILPTMRAGARDFITTSSRRSEVSGLVRRLLATAPASASADPDSGRVISVYNARSTSDNTLLAVSLAEALSERVGPNQVLLVDLGLPQGDVLDYLGVAPKFTFADAARNLRRLDRTLIDNAFYQHDESFRLLAMPDASNELAEVSSAELYLLLGTLRRYYKYVVFNLGGLPRSEFLQLLLGKTDHLLWVTDQSLSSCRQNAAILKQYRETKSQPSSVRLVIDRYRPNVSPDADSIAHTFDLPLETTLPALDEQRLRAMNSGSSLLKRSARDGYAKGVFHIVDRLEPSTAPKTIWDRLKVSLVAQLVAR